MGILGQVCALHFHITDKKNRLPLMTVEIMHADFFFFFTVCFETYGCQMNVNDTEIAWSILQKKGYQRTSDVAEVQMTFTFLGGLKCASPNISIDRNLWFKYTCYLFQADVVLLVTCSIR